MPIPKIRTVLKIVSLSSIGVIIPLSSANAKPKEIDLVKLGAETFTGKGCAECHSTEQDDQAVKTGPNLFGLFQKKPIQHKVIDGHEKHETTVVANDLFFNTSVRAPTDHLAIQSQGADKGKAYLPIMPAYSKKMLSSTEEKALYTYFQTLNLPANAGPSSVIIEEDEKDNKYRADSDSQAINTYDGTKVFRSFIDNGSSARSVHVGLENGQNFTFDPATLSIQSIWTGRFLDLRNEIKGRGGKANKRGHESTLWARKYTGILQPMLNGKKLFEDSLTNSIPDDFNETNESFVEQLAKIDGQFKGYTISEGKPTFHYTLQGNLINLRFDISKEGKLEAKITGKLKKELSLKFPKTSFSDIKVSSGSLDKSKGVWIISSLSKPAIWRAIPKDPQASSSQKKQDTIAGTSPFKWKSSKHEEDLIDGYEIQSANGPKYRVGGYPLFEPTAIDFDSKGNPVIGSRSAGIWKIINNQWQPFALGTFEVLGLHVKKDDSLIISQKPEITLIKDRNKDGIADSYLTLADDFRFIGNYHAYNHGPAVDSKGNIHFNLNLQHFNGDKIFKAKGRFMGSTGGLRGWSCQITKDGEFLPYAHGLRSSAGIAFSPNDALYYTDNQGEFMSTSKLFRIKKGAFYGHPSSRIDLANNTSSKVERDIKEATEEREVPAILMPHSHVANSPGHPVWDVTEGKFGPFSRQIFIGDQTLSNIHRVHLETVNGVEQGSIMPFADKLPSGPMRMKFSPDGELWVGQTGRGWASRGGNISALQKIKWKGKIQQAIHRVEARKDGFEIFFTQPISSRNQDSFEKTQIKSWYYLDSNNYGSKELGTRDETIEQFNWSKKGDSLAVVISNFGRHKEKSKDVGNTARVYQISLEKTGFGKGKSKFHSMSYYTLNEIPK